MTTTASAAPASALWAPDRRAATLGLVLLITLSAFEAMAVATALPTIVTALDGAALYSWPFTAYLAVSVIGNVLSGRACDRWGPAPSLLAGPALFLAGLLVAGLADSMAVLLVGRALQGLGGGTQVVAIYVLIALIYPERDRPAAFGLTSAAWVLPALVGPTVAGMLAEHLSWRLVFLGLAPLVLLAVVLLVPVVKSLLSRAGELPTPTVRRGLPLAAVAAGIGLSALTWASQHPSWLSLALGVGALALLVPALRRLLPPGTVTGRRGLPSVVLARGLLAGVFGAVEAYLPLTLSAVHGYSPLQAGIPLTLGALGWSAGSMWQSRRPDIPRHVLVRRGFALLAVGVGGSVLIAPPWGLALLAAPLWTLVGLGMGMAMSSLSVLLLHQSEPADRGFNSSALQLSDLLLQAACIGLGGVLLTTLASAQQPTAAVVVLDLVMAGVAVLGMVVAGRSVLAPARSTLGRR